jgi:hypothetical protein
MNDVIQTTTTPTRNQRGFVVESRSVLTRYFYKAALVRHWREVRLEEVQRLHLERPGLCPAKRPSRQSARSEDLCG